MSQSLPVLHARCGRSRGFTLIELLIVILVLSILIAVTVPSLIGVQRPRHHLSYSTSGYTLTHAPGAKR